MIFFKNSNQIAGCVHQLCLVGKVDLKPHPLCFWPLFIIMVAMLKQLVQNVVKSWGTTCFASYLQKGYVH